MPHYTLFLWISKLTIKSAKKSKESSRVAALPAASGPKGKGWVGLRFRHGLGLQTSLYIEYMLVVNSHLTGCGDIDDVGLCLHVIIILTHVSVSVPTYRSVNSPGIKGTVTS